MALIPDSLKESIKSKLPFSGGGTKESSSPTPDRSVKEFQIAAKIIAKNFMSLPGIARDLNVARQNAQQLVKVMGGKAATGADDEFLKASKREKKLEVESEEERAKDLEFFKEQQKEKEKAPTQIITQEKLKDENKPSTIFDKLKKYLALGVLVTLFVVTFFDDFVAKVKEWANNLWTTIKEKFDEFVQYMRNWFDETVQPIIENVKEIFNKVIEKISAFFTSVGEWVAEKFAKIKEFFEPVVEFIKGVFDKFMGVIDKVKEGFQKFKDFIKPYVENALDTPIVKYLPPVLALKALTGAKSPEEKKEEKKKPVPVTPGYEEGAAADAMASGVEGEPYIPEPEAPPPKPPPPKPPAPTPTPTPAPTPAPQDGVLVDSEGRPVQTGFGEDVRTGEMEPPAPTPTPAPPPAPAPARPSVAPTPAPPPKPITEQPPTPTGKAAEVPGGTPGLVVSALNDAGITSTKAHANVLATVKAESNFKVKSENLNYTSADRIQKIFGKRRIPSIDFAQQFVKNPEALANHVYKTTDGNSAPEDGFKYRGRGFIQHTGKNQYAAISKATGTDLLSNPDALNSPEVAAKAIPWFFLGYKRMKPEDLDNMSKVNKAVGFAGGAEYAAKREESAQQIYAQMQSGSGTQMASASTDVASGQRGQQKPTTPIIINSPKTTNTVVQNNIPSSGAKSKTDAGKTLMNRVT
jgi:predicted chitinase/DNA replication initiation complex subunit (GINS family)